jgi:peptide/nickel transport system ATP-binding protein
MTLLVAEDVHRVHRLPRTSLVRPGETRAALAGVSLQLGRGETLGVVGASGSGKSTLARIVMALERPDRGRVLFAGHDLARLDADALRRLRPRFQIVFQDPGSALDPRRPVGWSVAEPLMGRGTPKAEREAAAVRALDAVGLSAADATRFPHAFSGGQRQRIAIARAIVGEPDLIVADEAVSALDVSVQAQILNLFMEIQARTGAALIFVSHDLAAVSRLCDRVMVMEAGRVAEEGDAASVLAAPQSAAGKALVEAAFA